MIEKLIKGRYEFPHAEKKYQREGNRSKCQLVGGLTPCKGILVLLLTDDGQFQQEFYFLPHQRKKKNQMLHDWIQSYYILSKTNFLFSFWLSCLKSLRNPKVEELKSGFRLSYYLEVPCFGQLYLDNSAFLFLLNTNWIQVLITMLMYIWIILLLFSLLQFISTSNQLLLLPCYSQKLNSVYASFWYGKME